VSPVYVFENVEYGGENVRLPPLCVVTTGLDNVTVVPSTMLAIVVPVGTPGPRTTMPTAKFAVLASPPTTPVA
jgi:hypothetical protein